MIQVDTDLTGSCVIQVDTDLTGSCVIQADTDGPEAVHMIQTDIN